MDGAITAIQGGAVDFLPKPFDHTMLVERVKKALARQAVLARDYPVVLALFGSTSGLSLLGFLVSDLLLPLVDPRISFGRTAA